MQSVNVIRIQSSRLEKENFGDQLFDCPSALLVCKVLAHSHKESKIRRLNTLVGLGLYQVHQMHLKITQRAPLPSRRREGKCNTNITTTLAVHLIIPVKEHQAGAISNDLPHLENMKLANLFPSGCKEQGEHTFNSEYS